MLNGVRMDRLVAMLRAAGDPTRLRLLLLLRQAELTVSELIEIVLYRKLRFVMQ